MKELSGLVPLLLIGGLAYFLGRSQGAAPTALAGLGAGTPMRGAFRGHATWAHVPTNMSVNGNARWAV